MTTETKYEPARIVGGSMGSYGDPPGYPSHSYKVQTGLQRRPENRDTMSIEYAATCEYIDPSVRRRAQQILDDWMSTRDVDWPLSSRLVQLWIRKTLAYFKNCYKGPQGWNASDLHICGGRQEVTELDELGDAVKLAHGAKVKSRGFWPVCLINHPDEDHAGVHAIQKYYPEYERRDVDALIDCGDCGHHLNSHNDTGRETPCKVIMDQVAYDEAKARGLTGQASEILSTLCNCSSYFMIENPGTRG